MVPATLIILSMLENAHFDSIDYDTKLKFIMIKRIERTLI